MGEADREGTHEQDIAFTGLAGQARSLAAGDVSSAELTAAALDRIEHTQPTINAFRRVRARAAAKEAAEADRRLAAGERAPLLGVPVAIKDDTDIAGLPTAFGCAGDFPVAAQDAELVTRLKNAGAVIVGKTNTPELGQWPFTEGLAFGVTRNPWHEDYSPGGSSGGSAAAVAAGLVAAATGSDGAGSVRIPAAWNGLVGIKPQRYRIPTAPEPELFHGLTGHGPLARTVSDAALLLDVLAGTGDTYQSAALARPRRLRVGLSVRAAFSLFPSRLDARVRAAVTRLAGLLLRLGHDVVPMEPPYGLLGLDFLPRSLGGVYDWTRRAPDPAALDERTQGNVRTGKWLRPLVPLARRAESLGHRRVGRVFRGADAVDVVLAPTTATLPPRAGYMNTLSNVDTDREMIAQCPYTWPWNVLGWPAMNIPAGLTEEGLPLGAQLLGPAHSEELLISLAAELEDHERWYLRRPVVSA